LRKVFILFCDMESKWRFVWRCVVCSIRFALFCSVLRKVGFFVWNVVFCLRNVLRKFGGERGGGCDVLRNDEMFCSVLQCFVQNSDWRVGWWL